MYSDYFVQIFLDLRPNTAHACLVRRVRTHDHVLIKPVTMHNNYQQLLPAARYNYVQNFVDKCFVFGLYTKKFFCYCIRYQFYCDVDHLNL